MYCPLRSMNKTASFCDKVSNDKFSLLGKFSRYVSTILTSHILEYFGKLGFFTKIPFINLLIIVSFPMSLLLIRAQKEEIADFAVFIALYPMFCSCNDIKNSKTFLEGGSNISICLSQENCIHLLK